MTTFQEPQPQSRRAMRQRQSESGDGRYGQSDFAQFPPAQQAAPQFYPNTPSSEAMWDTTARRAAQLPSSGPGPGAAGRSAPAGMNAEPLNYSTFNMGELRGAPHAADPGTRSLAPISDAQSFLSRLDGRQGASTAGPRGTQGPPAGSTQASQPQYPQAAQPGEAYRIRDFSPEGRRPAETPGAPPFPSQPSDLNYQTEVRAGFGGQTGYSQPTPGAPGPLSYAQQAPYGYGQQQPGARNGYPDAPGEQTMSRRELRAMLATQEAAAGPVPLREPGPWVAPRDYSQPQQTQQPLAFPQQQQQSAQQSHQVWETPGQPDGAMPWSAPAPAVWSPPVGHWSTQLDADDAGDEYETTVNRRVGSGLSTTSALVLPTAPPGTDIRGPLTRTGEVMLTGSIDLPRNLASMGVSDRMDYGGVDSPFESNDFEITATDSAPVRAVAAVSTRTSGHQVTHTHIPKGTGALTALLVSASIMAVAVAGLLVAAFAFHIL